MYAASHAPLSKIFAPRINWIASLLVRGNRHSRYYGFLKPRDRRQLGRDFTVTEV